MQRQAEKEKLLESHGFAAEQKPHEVGVAVCRRDAESGAALALLVRVGPGLEEQLRRLDLPGPRRLIAHSRSAERKRRLAPGSNPPACHLFGRVDGGHQEQRSLGPALRDRRAGLEQRRHHRRVPLHHLRGSSFCEAL